MDCKCNQTKNLVINKMNYNLCTKCGLLQKVVFPSLEEAKNRYDNHICDENYYNYMHKIFDEIKNHLNQGNCLDFGCGKVHALSDILNTNGYETDYYDLIYYPLLKNKKYDNIILIEVFEHLEQPYEALNNLLKLLKKNGKIIIKTKPYEIDNLKNWWYLRDITHVSFITNETISFWDLNVKIKNYGDIFVLKSI